jgi:hypothetical protein
VTARGEHVPNDPVTLIEQAIARGQSIEWMVDRLGVTVPEVFRVMARMDTAVRETDRTCPGAGLRKKVI